jgi:hypothetical protein
MRTIQMVKYCEHIDHVAEPVEGLVGCHLQGNFFKQLYKEVSNDWRMQQNPSSHRQFAHKSSKRKKLGSGRRVSGLPHQSFSPGGAAPLQWTTWWIVRQYWTKQFHCPDYGGSMHLWNIRLLHEITWHYNLEGYNLNSAVCTWNLA